MGSGGAMLDIDTVGGGSVDPEKVTWHPSTYYEYTVEPAESVKEHVMANAGPGKISL
jgi:pectate lyase